MKLNTIMKFLVKSFLPRTMREFSIMFFVLLLRTCCSMDVKPQKEKYLPDYHVYHNLSSIYHKLSGLSTSHTNNCCVHVDNSFRSRHSRIQFVVRLTNMTNSSPKPRILIVSGTHAREMFPVESALYLIKNITKGLRLKKSSYEYKYAEYVVNHVDLFVIPVLNPDGKFYVEKFRNYCWRGTATGVDLERNFGWSYGGRGSSSNADDEEYRGTGAFSEPECQVLLNLTKSRDYDVYISLHSGIRQIYIPFSDTESKMRGRRPDNMKGMMELAAMLTKAPSSGGFEYGLARELTEYPADGTTFDFMSGIRQIPFSLTIELWGRGQKRDKSCFDLFNPTSQDLRTEIRNVHSIYEALFLYMIRWKKQQIHRRNYLAIRHDEPSLTLGLVMLCIVVILTVIYTIQHKLPLWMRILPRRRIISLRTLSSTFSFLTYL